MTPQEHLDEIIKISKLHDTRYDSIQAILRYVSLNRSDVLHISLVLKSSGSDSGMQYDSLSVNGTGHIILDRYYSNVWVEFNKMINGVAVFDPIFRCNLEQYISEEAILNRKLNEILS